jgi:hypothetical protein
MESGHMIPRGATEARMSRDAAGYGCSQVPAGLKSARNVSLPSLRHRSPEPATGSIAATRDRVRASIEKDIRC